MLVMFAGIFLSEISSDKWSANQSEKSERSYDDAENRQDDDCYDKPDIASTDSSLGSAEFFGSSWWDDIIENGKEDDDHCPDDEKSPSERMSWGQLEKNESDIRKQRSRQYWQYRAYDSQDT